MRKILIMLTIVVTMMLVSCQSKYTYQEEKVNITVTTNILADLARQIGGDHVAIHTLMKSGVDPHLYVPKPSDYTALNQADFILVSGLNLEGKMSQVLATYESRKHVLLVGNKINTDSVLREKLLEDDNFKGNYDPHIWFDISLWNESARFIMLELIKIDPTNQIYYENSYVNYLEQTQKLDEYIRSQLTNLTIKEKVLVTAHDAFAYFGVAYEVDVRALQGLSSDSEISLKTVREIVDLLIEKNVQTVFAETSVPIEVIKSVVEAAKSRGHIVKISAKQLYSDSLGDNEHNSYIEMYKYNINTIVQGLKGEL